MKFDFNNRENVNNFRVNHQISQDNDFHNQYKFSKSREEARYKRLKRLLANFALILAELLVIILIAFYFVSPLNRISSVSVRGNRTILASSMIRNMNAKPGDSVFRLMAHTSRFKKYAFEQNAQLKSIHVRIHKWNHVNVKMSEYPVIAYLSRHNHYYAVTNNGRTAYQCTKVNQAYPILVNFKASQKLRSFVKTYRQLPNSVKPDIDKIVYSLTNIDPDRIHVYMSDGNQIYANYKNWQRKMKYYSAISKSMKKRGTINMELGVYSKAFRH